MHLKNIKHMLNLYNKKMYHTVPYMIRLTFLLQCPGEQNRQAKNSETLLYLFFCSFLEKKICVSWEKNSLSPLNIFCTTFLFLSWILLCKSFYRNKVHALAYFHIKNSKKYNFWSMQRMLDFVNANFERKKLIFYLCSEFRV